MSLADNDQAAAGTVGRAAARLKSLKVKRSQIKSQCIRFRSYVDGLEIENVNVAELRQRLQKFSELWETFVSVQGGIEEIEIDPDKVVSHGEELHLKKNILTSHRG